MKQKFDEEFPEDEPDPIPEEYEGRFLGNTVELSNKGFSQTMVQEMKQNSLKIAKLKLKNLKKEKKQIKQYLKQNQMKKGTKEEVIE